MKKTLIAMAAFAVTGAFAQVTIYGKLDVGYASSSDTTQGKTTNASGVKSDNSAASYWGIKGTEDLGGGNSAFFILEQDLYPADGNQGVSNALGGANSNAAFNRISEVGVSGAFGSIAFGRDYNPLFRSALVTDINFLSRGSTVALATATGGSTVANQLVYNSPVFSGFQVKGTFGFDDNSTSQNFVTGGTTTGTSAIGLNYTNGPLFLTAATGGTTTQNGSARGTSVSYFASSAGNASAASMGTAAIGITTAQSITGSILGGFYDFGSFKLVGNYLTSTATNIDLAAANGGNAVATQLNLGVTVPVGKILLKAQVSSNKLHYDGNAYSDLTGNSMVIGADYNLSSKTAVFVTGGTVNNLSNEVMNQSSHTAAVGFRTVF